MQVVHSSQGITNYQPTCQPLPPEFYDHVSEIIKIFRKQLALFTRLSSYFIEESELIQEMTNKKEQGLILVKQYEIFPLYENIYPILQRFIGRIKEILQLASNITPAFMQFFLTCIKKIELSIHKNQNNMTVYQVFSDLLNILPSYFQNKVLSPQKSKTKQKQSKENTPLQQKKASSTLDLILQSYRKSFSLLSTLDIDETQYRAVFFSARDDKYKGTSFLENEMKYRNRFIREEMSRYDQGYVNYKEKTKRDTQNSKKKNMSRLKRMMSLDEQNSIVKVTSGKAKNLQKQEITHAINSQKNINEDKSIQTPQLRPITNKHQKSNLLQTAFNFNKVSRDQKAISHLSNYRQRQINQSTKKTQGNSSYSKAREDEFHDFVNQINSKGQFRMTKVLFGKDGKLELSPHTQMKPNTQNPTLYGLKNKIIFRKAQENIRKKLNRLTTQPPSSKFTSKPKCSPPKEITNYISSQLKQNYQKIENINKRTPKIELKEKEIKFMGIKGISNKGKGCSFEDTDKFWMMNNNSTYYMKVQERNNGRANKSLIT